MYSSILCLNPKIYKPWMVFSTKNSKNLHRFLETPGVEVLEVNGEGGGCSWIWDGRMDGFLLERSRFLMAGKKKRVVCMVFLLDPKIMFLDFLEKRVEELVKIIKFGPMMLRVLGLLAFACCLKHGSLWVFWYQFYWQTCLAGSQDSNPNLLEMLQFIKESSWICAPVLRHTRLIS